MARRRRGKSRRRAWVWAAAGVIALAALAVTAMLIARARRPPGDLVARVLFAEAAGVSPQERRLVAGVIRNRIGHPGFGRLGSAAEVVAQPGAFSCIDDPQNGNWEKSARPDLMKPSERAAWDDCVLLSRGTLPEAVGPSGRPLVYYHDKSITKPRSWDNAAWRAVRETVTPHFVFYSVVPAGK